MTHRGFELSTRTPTRLRRNAKRAFAAVAAVSLGVVGLAPAAMAAPEDQSEAEGRLLSGGGIVYLNGLGALAPAYSADDSFPEESVSPLSLEVLQALDIDLGGGVQLFGENGVIGVGALGQYANTEGAVPFASSGAVNADGSIAIGGGGPADDAYLDLTPLLGAAGPDGLLTQDRKSGVQGKRAAV